MSVHGTEAISTNEIKMINSFLQNLGDGKKRALSNSNEPWKL